MRLNPLKRKGKSHPDHKVGDTVLDPFRVLENWARAHFPQLGALAFSWSGQILEPHDGLAFLGRNPASPDNIYIVTGDSGNGLTHGTIGAMIIGDLIQGRANPWSTLYDPARKNMHPASVQSFVKENAHVAAQYFDYVKPGEVAHADEIGPGEGALLRQGLQVLAVYRDEKSRLHCVSAVCSHLAGIVHWNASEKTWDCPCHGSRFDVEGNVINGPALSNLAAAGLRAKAEDAGRSSPSGRHAAL